MTDEPHGNYKLLFMSEINNLRYCETPERSENIFRRRTGKFSIEDRFKEIENLSIKI